MKCQIYIVKRLYNICRQGRHYSDAIYFSNLTSIVDRFAKAAES
jgi:hypothetical protein